VWTFGHLIREIERSHQQVVVEETATKGAVIGFGAFALLDLVSFRKAHGQAFAVGVVLAFFMSGLVLYAAISSSFVADRSRRVLIIKRRIGVLTLEKVYEAKEIDRIYVRSTSKGSGLYARFKSGRSKGLTMSLGCGDSLEEVAAALNQFLCVPHRG
jgi:hypothetical protein